MQDISNISTYQAGVYQTKAYRALQEIKTGILKKHGLSATQWAVLGFIFDAGKQGVRISELAKILDTTQAFVTNTVNTLEAKGFVTRTTNSDDSRAKQVIIKPKHRKLVQKIEADVREQLRLKLYTKISREELQTYIKVLAKFSEA